MNVRLLLCGVISVLLALASANRLRSQDPAPAAQPHDQFLAGTITALSDTSITVTRTVMGKDSTIRTFAITPTTEIKGKPKMDWRVTVRFVSEENGDRAVRIIVRGPPQPKKQ
jgi:hypothetical protein